MNLPKNKKIYLQRPSRVGTSPQKTKPKTQNKDKFESKTREEEIIKDLIDFIEKIQLQNLENPRNIDRDFRQFQSHLPGRDDVAMVTSIILEEIKAHSLSIHEFRLALSLFNFLTTTTTSKKDLLAQIKSFGMARFSESILLARKEAPKMSLRQKVFMAEMFPLIPFIEPEIEAAGRASKYISENYCDKCEGDCCHIDFKLKDDRESAYCYFYREGTCSIYSIRPPLCRVYLCNKVNITQMAEDIGENEGHLRQLLFRPV